MTTTVEEIIMSRIGYEPKNLNGLVEMYNVIKNNPCQRTGAYPFLLDKSPATTYRLLKTLKDLRIVKRNNTIATDIALEEIEFREPLFLKEGNITTNKWHRLVILLSRFQEQEVPPGFTKCKSEILHQLSAQIMDKPEELFNLGAEYYSKSAIAIKDLTKFQHTIGTLIPVTERDFPELA